jgi:hypothetical protein
MDALTSLCAAVTGGALCRDVDNLPNWDKSHLYERHFCSLFSIVLTTCDIVSLSARPRSAPLHSHPACSLITISTCRFFHHTLSGASVVVEIAHRHDLQPVLRTSR